MNRNNARISDADFNSVLETEGESVGVSGLSAFIVLPMPLAANHYSQNPAQFQHALYLAASEQASVVVREARRRRQLLFSRGAYLWN